MSLFQMLRKTRIARRLRTHNLVQINIHTYIVQILNRRRFNIYILALVGLVTIRSDSISFFATDCLQRTPVVALNIIMTLYLMALPNVLVLNLLFVCNLWTRFYLWTKVQSLANHPVHSSAHLHHGPWSFSHTIKQKTLSRSFSGFFVCSDEWNVCVLCREWHCCGEVQVNK